MEKLRFLCRVEKKITNHAVLKNEVPLGMEVALMPKLRRYGYQSTGGC
jgi:hypothetical protein